MRWTYSWTCLAVFSANKANSQLFYPLFLFLSLSRAHSLLLEIRFQFLRQHLIFCVLNAIALYCWSCKDNDVSNHVYVVQMFNNCWIGITLVNKHIPCAHGASSSVWLPVHKQKAAKNMITSSKHGRII